MLAPEATEDPLRWSEEVDPALRRPSASTKTLRCRRRAMPRRAEPGSSGALAPAGPSQRPSRHRKPHPSQHRKRRRARTCAHARRALRILDWLFPTAFAAPGRPPDLEPYSSPLDGFVPRSADLDVYLPQVARLLLWQ
jgi:hypothetical protein